MGKREKSRYKLTLEEEEKSIESHRIRPFRMFFHCECDSIR